MKKLQPIKANPVISHPLFDANPELWASTISTLRQKTFDNNEHIVLHGDAAANLWLVLSGWIKLTRQTPDGKETIVGLCTDGDVFGKAALFADANYPYTAEVVGSSAELAAIPATTIRSLVKQEPSLSARMMELLNKRTSQAQLKLEHMTTMSAAQRLGCFLLRLCSTQAEGAKALYIPVEKNVLAAYLGMKPETLSRSQQQLKEVNVEISGADVTVKNVAMLRQFVCGSCSESGMGDCEAEQG